MPYFLLKPALSGQVTVNDFLSRDECRGIIEGGERTVGLHAGSTGDRRASIRQSDIGWFSPEGEHQWLFKRIGDCVTHINRDWFGFNLLAFEGVQFTKYSGRDKDSGGDYYGAHKDTSLVPGGTIRKLSFTIQLCEGDTYEGGDVVLYDSFTDMTTLNRQLGSISFFPSFTIHEVTPVTKGTRYSLVGWACGPSFV